MIETDTTDVVSLIGTGEFDMDSEVNAIRRVIDLTRASHGIHQSDEPQIQPRPVPAGSRSDRPREPCWSTLPVGMILSMPDDDDENWRTLIDTAATEYAGELGKDMLGLIAQSEGNTQARTILAGWGFPKAASIDKRGTDPGSISRSGRNLRVQPAARTPQGRRRLFPRPITCGRILMAGSVDAQIASLREIDGTIRPEDRPEWFTTEWIDQAEREMKAPSDNTGTALLRRIVRPIRGVRECGHRLHRRARHGRGNQRERREPVRRIRGGRTRRERNAPWLPARLVRR